MTIPRICFCVVVIIPVTASFCVALCTINIPMILSISAYMMILKLRLLRCRFCPVFLLRMPTDHSFLYLYLLFLTAESSVTVNKRILPAFRFRYRQMFFSDTGRYFEIVFVISCSIQLNVSECTAYVLLKHHLYQPLLRCLSRANCLTL